MIYKYRCNVTQLHNLHNHVVAIMVQHSNPFSHIFSPFVHLSVYHCGGTKYYIVTK